MPGLGTFRGADHFHNVSFHELTHWTGHKSRLNRDLKRRFGSRDYAAEELVAELTLSPFCFRHGLTLVRVRPSKNEEIGWMQGVISQVRGRLRRLS